MELSLEAIIGIVSLLVGGSGFVGIVTWRYAKKKAKAEATEAEALAEKAKYESVQAAVNATKEVQDSYQQLLADMKTDREEQRAYAEEQKQYIAELKEDRRHLRAERDELRTRVENIEKIQRDLQFDIARMGRTIEALRPLACGRAFRCSDRIPVTISEGGETDTPSPATANQSKLSNASTSQANGHTERRTTQKTVIDPYNGD